VIDFKKHDQYKSTYQDLPNQSNQLVSDKYFETNKLTLTRSLQRELLQLDSFIIYICVEGSGSITAGTSTVAIKKGETVLIPASIATISLLPNETLTLLETYVPHAHE
jgi:mannose-6-phosphate isomerase